MSHDLICLDYLIANFYSAVLHIEMIKFGICHIVTLYNEGGDLRKFSQSYFGKLYLKEIALISVPAFCVHHSEQFTFRCIRLLGPDHISVVLSGAYLVYILFLIQDF